MAKLLYGKNPDIRLKDGTISIGKKILIDGQRCVTALQAAIAGMLVTDANYRRKPIRIAFNPLTETFEVLNPAIERDCKWIPDISKVFEPTFEEFQFIIQYCKDNDLMGQEGAISRVISKLKRVLDISLGVTDWNQGLSINKVNPRGTCEPRQWVCKGELGSKHFNPRGSCEPRQYEIACTCQQQSFQSTRLLRTSTLSFLRHRIYV